MKQLKEGVVRYNLITPTPELDNKIMMRQVRRFDEDAYLFPIKAKPYVSDAIASAVDIDIVKNLVLGQHMDLYTPDFQKEQLLTLSQNVIESLLKNMEPGETLEQIFNKSMLFVDEFEKKAKPNVADAVSFAFQMGEAVAFGQLTKRHYDTETTYLPTLTELDQLSPSDRQITQLCGYHASFLAIQSILKKSAAVYHTPFSELLEMLAWGGYNFSFKDNDFAYEIRR